MSLSQAAILAPVPQVGRTLFFSQDNTEALSAIARPDLPWIGL